ncbi:alpha/beta fold hydrolase [Clostridiales bacterium COT073_COT-073]|nr:alpha/beta fold hydrolase [Clostridiales bacterium COT073_COT-073]
MIKVLEIYNIEVMVTEQMTVKEEKKWLKKWTCRKRWKKTKLGGKEMTVKIANGNYEIPAIITLPEGAGLFPAVVMLHGTGSDKNEVGGGYAMLASAFAKAGIASIRIDFIGSGDSTGDYKNYNFTTAVADANAACDYLAKMPEINRDKIGIMGWSQGGTIALLAAGQNPAFQSALTWAGEPDLSDMLPKEAYETAQKDGFYTMEFEWRTALNVGLQWFKEVEKTDVLKVFANSKAPVLAINGTDDTAVAPEKAGQIKAASTHPQSKALLLEKADHTFHILADDKSTIEGLIKTTVDWFGETLK